MKETIKQEYIRALQTLSMVLEGKNRKALLWAVKLAKKEVDVEIKKPD